MLTTEAQIFVLERGSGGQTWTEASSRAIPVHLYHDLSRRSFRIIAVEGSKPVLNGVVTSSLRLNKASSKFLQWMDGGASVVYGLGFGSERELDAFVETVEKMQKLCEEKYEGAGSESAEREWGPVNGGSGGSTGNAGMPTETVDSDSEDGGPSSTSVLKMENVRLKAALCQSSVNAKKWEMELSELKEVNAELRRELERREGAGAGESAAVVAAVGRDWGVGAVALCGELGEKLAGLSETHQSLQRHLTTPPDAFKSI